MLKCFVIAPIGPEGSDIRKHSDDLMGDVIRPVVYGDLGYDVIRADEIADPGSITSQALEAVIEWDLVIAVLTFHNPNVFYELAVRHAAHKPYIQMISSEERIPFDLSDFRTIHYPPDLKDDLQGRDKAKLALREQVLATQAEGFIVDSPLSRAVNIATLHAQDDPIAEGIAELRREVAQIPSAVYRLINPSGTFQGWTDGSKIELNELRRLNEEDRAIRATDKAIDAGEVSPPVFALRWTSTDTKGVNPRFNIDYVEGSQPYSLEAEIREPEDARGAFPIALHLGTTDSQWNGVGRPSPGIYKRFTLGDVTPGQSLDVSMQPALGGIEDRTLHLRIIAHTIDTDSPMVFASDHSLHFEEL